MTRRRSALHRPAALLALALVPLHAAQADAWNPTNDPSRFGGGLVYGIASLPVSGDVTATPWSPGYLPVYERWAVAPDAIRESADCWSALASGGAAIDEAALSQAVDACPASAASGEREDAGEDEPFFQVDTSEGAATEQRFTMGLCHAWVAASILEPEPRLEVNVGGGTLSADQIGDLLAIAYSTTLGRAAGSACSIGEGDDTLTIDEDGFIQEPMSYAVGGSALTIDEDGFIVDPTCYDGNAGTFHVLLGNLVGLEGRAFALDLSTAASLELAPVLGYRQVVEDGLDIPALEGLLDRAGWSLLDHDADSFAWVESTVTFLAPADEDGTSTRTWTYVLELDASGAITGGTWGSGGLATAPDFFLLPVAAAAAIDGLDLEAIATVAALAADQDDDGVGDGVDACPGESGAGLDADADGCVDTVWDLPALVSSVALASGTATSLLASADAAVASAERGDSRAAANQLAAFSSKVGAQRGKKITEVDAALLVAFAANAARSL